MFQDPIFTDASGVAAAGANGLLAFIRSVAIAAGWTVDQYDTSPLINSETGGYELYLRPGVTGVSNPPRYSLKAFAGTVPDQHGVKVWMNTGYDSTKRVDNQPGMYAQSKPWPNNAVSRQEVFSGQWDSAPNANPLDSGMYLTAAWDAMNPLAGSVPRVPGDVPSLHTYATTQMDMVYAFYDARATGSSQCLVFFWYCENVMYGMALGHVLWDNENRVAPYDSEGHLLQVWGNIFTDRTLENDPVPNSLGATVNLTAVTEVVRNRTKGSETFPAGTPDGSALMESGPVVLQDGRIEASDNRVDANISAIVRPDQDFRAVHNNVQGDAFPNPRITTHREHPGGVSQERIALHRPRHISRFPNGGALVGDFARGEGSNDWSDSGFVFPVYYCPTIRRQEGDIVAEGSRQYRIFPGNRSGVSPYTQAHRIAGLAMRVA